MSPLVIELVVRRTADQEAPFDVAFRTTRSVMQLTWLTVALVVVCLVALPTLIVAGQAGLHIRLNLVDWMRLAHSDMHDRARDRRHVNSPGTRGRHFPQSRLTSERASPYDPGRPFRVMISVRLISSTEGGRP